MYHHKLPSTQSESPEETIPAYPYPASLFLYVIYFCDPDDGTRAGNVADIGGGG